MAKAKKENPKNIHHDAKMCNHCDIRPRKKTGVYRPTGRGFYALKCSFCIKHPNIGAKAKSKQCSICFSDFHPVQLDLDHIDGNKCNEEFKNLQMICACCHRLKSYMYKNYTNKEYR